MFGGCAGAGNRDFRCSGKEPGFFFTEGREGNEGDRLSVSTKCIRVSVGTKCGD